jgi:exodeoxyribonuclease VII large subunit
MIPAAADLQNGQAVRLVFADGARGARIDGGQTPAPTQAPAVSPKARTPPPGQGDLF